MGNRVSTAKVYFLRIEHSPVRRKRSLATRPARDSNTATESPRAESCYGAASTAIELAAVDEESSESSCPSVVASKVYASKYGLPPAPTAITNVEVESSARLAGCTPAEVVVSSATVYVIVVVPLEVIVKPVTFPADVVPCPFATYT
jgi:hypothetical protein